MSFKDENSWRYGGIKRRDFRAGKTDVPEPVKSGKKKGGKKPFVIEYYGKWWKEKVNSWKKWGQYKTLSAAENAFKTVADAYPNCFDYEGRGVVQWRIRDTRTGERYSETLVAVKVPKRVGP